VAEHAAAGRVTGASDPAGGAGAVREERKVVTALFVDVVGSTALGERLDSEDVKLVVGEAVARIVGELEALGGHIKDLAGDGVLAFFGAPTSREDDAERAVRAALRVLAEMEEYGRDVRRGWGIEGFGVRVGAATGTVVLGEVGAGSRVEYAAFGDTVNVAARLQGAAEPGTVLVDDATHLATEAFFDWGDARALDVKGKASPVRAWQVAGVRTGTRRPRGLAGVETRLVGRVRELGLGRDALEALRSGKGGIFVASGEPGIGKSRLLAELHATAEQSGIRWLEGRCVSYGETLPYWPFRDLLRTEWIGAGADEAELRVRVGLRRRLEQLFTDRAGELYPYLGVLLGLALEPDAAAHVAQLSPEALQWRTFEVVGELFAALADVSPLVLAIEDLHWADSTSLALLEQLLVLAEQAPVLVVLSLRTERDHPASAAGARPRPARRRGRRAARRARRREHASGRARAAAARRGRWQPVLPRGARALVRRRRCAHAAGRRLAVRPRGRDRSPPDRRAGDPRPARPALARVAERRHRRSGSRAPVRASPARRRRRRRLRRSSPRPAAARPDPAEPPLASGGVPVSTRAHPGDRVPLAARPGARRAAPPRRGVARDAVRRS
jgi:class 3 adenylate cyclase